MAYVGDVDVELTEDPNALVKAAQSNSAKLRELLNSGKARVRK